MWTLLFSLGLTSIFLSSTFAQSPLQIDIEKKFPGEDESTKGNILKKSNDLLSTTVYRLPRTVIPSRYVLNIIPIIENDDPIGVTQWTAHGDVKIFAKCEENTKSLTLHANGLNITQNFVYVMDVETRDTVTISSHAYDAEKHFYIIHFVDELISGKEYEIFIRYVAPIADIDAMDGLYRSYYEDPATNTTRYLVATQMETIHARQMFPCMDEPEFKAVFEISIGRNQAKGYEAWANTELVRSAPMPGGLNDWVVDTFAPTTLMSTYLVAILVANDYNCTKADPNLYNKTVQICAPNYIIEKGGGVYGAEVAAKHMQFLEDYFNVTYKFSKIDSASVPHFGSGAMENWGLNLYRESYLLFFEGETTEAERFLVSEVLGHELTHQWFGNLVTNKWWSEIWLNEGFATYYSYIASQITDPEFEPTVIGQLNDCLQYSMAFAARWDYAHPVYQPVDSPTEVDLMFDRMAYEKAGSLIRMMQGFLTEPTLKTGLTAYLNKMEYKGAEQDDLFSALTAQAHSDGTLDSSLTVKGIMDTWTKRKGFPLVRVTRADATKLLISQEEFRNNDDMGIKGHRYPVQQDLESLWYIPVALITEDAPAVSLAPKLWISGDVAMTSFNHDTNKWILINPDAFGYYRVLYDGHLATLLQNQLNRNHSVISKMSRSQLLDDYLTFAFQKYVPIDKALEMTRYLHSETEFVVWKSVITNLRKTYNMLSSTSAINGFRNYFLPRLMFGALASIGIEQKEIDKGAVVIFRSQVLDWACSMEDETCVQYAVRLFDEWVANPTINTIPVDLQPIVYCTGVATKGESAFNFAFEQYKIATASRQQTLLLNSLACSKEVSLLQTVLEYAQDPTSGLRRTHAISAIQRVAMNPLGRSLVLRFLNSNLNGIISEFGSATPIATVVSTLSTYFNTNADMNTLNLFMSSHETQLSPIKASLDTSVINVATNIQWMKDFYDGMNTWLNAQQT